MLILSLAAMFLMGFAAIGVRVLRDFSRHRLEALCRRRNQRDLFGTIVSEHDEVALGAESLRILATVLFVVTGTMSVLGNATATRLTQDPIVAIGALAVGMLLVAAVNLWVPTAVVHIWSASFLYNTWGLWRTVSWMMLPMSFGVSLMDAFLRRLADQPKAEDEEEEAFEEEIRSIVTAGQQEGLLDGEAREMIEGVMDLDDVDVANIMTPRSEIDALDIRVSWQEAVDFVVECGHTRIPVHDGSMDNVVGILYAKDVLRELAKPQGEERVTLTEILRTAIRVPKSKPVDDLLHEFRSERKHMAIVVDEFEATAGVVTIEDALEEIVGEIADEYDTDEALDYQRIDDDCIEAVGRAHLDDLNEQFGLSLPDPDDYDTIGGLVVDQLGRIPKAGETLEVGGLTITVLAADKKKIQRVRLQSTETQRETAQ